MTGRNLLPSRRAPGRGSLLKGQCPDGERGWGQGSLACQASALCAPSSLTGAGAPTWHGTPLRKEDEEENGEEVRWEGMGVDWEQSGG
jgi:hypothetical protein